MFFVLHAHCHVTIRARFVPMFPGPQTLTT